MPTPACTRPALILAASLLGGCATFSQDGGLGGVAEITRERMAITPEVIRTPQDAGRVAEEVRRLLGEPLSPDSVVRIAVLNNRGLQASLATLGIAEADLVQAGRLHNPGFSFGRLAGAGEVEFERKFLFDLMGLLTLSSRGAIEQRRFETTRLAVANEALRLAQSARQAYFSAVAARQATRHQEQVTLAAEAAAELAKRMADVGNFSRLRQQREALVHAEMGAELARARQNELNARERLVRLLGLSGTQRALTLPDRLPDLPASPLPEQGLVRQALDSRLDLRMARLEIEGLAKSLALGKATRFVNVLDVSYLNNTSTGGHTTRGYEIELVLPLFDSGDARTARAESLYNQALHRVAETAVNAESEVHDRYGAYRTAFDLARRYRDEIAPLRKSISEETLLRYNGMLLGIWDLLADARQQIASANAAIQAQKDFWVAESNLQMSLNGSGTGDSSLSATSTMSAEAGGGH